MPNHLENVVRPSQSPRIRPGFPNQLFETAKVPQNNPQTWGSPGNSVFQLRASEQSEVPEPKFEAQRTYDIVRVYNPDDRTQYVDTEQMTEYQGRNKLNSERFTMKFATNSNTENTEVIQKGLIRKSNT
jgi:hypothetical protein